MASTAVLTVKSEASTLNPASSKNKKIPVLGIIEANPATLELSSYSGPAIAIVKPFDESMQNKKEDVTQPLHIDDVNNTDYSNNTIPIQQRPAAQIPPTDQYDAGPVYYQTPPSDQYNAGPVYYYQTPPTNQYNAGPVYYYQTPPTDQYNAGPVYYYQTPPTDKHNAGPVYYYQRPSTDQHNAGPVYYCYQIPPDQYDAGPIYHYYYQTPPDQYDAGPVYGQMPKVSHLYPNQTPPTNYDHQTPQPTDQHSAAPAPQTSEVSYSYPPADYDNSAADAYHDQTPEALTHKSHISPESVDKVDKTQKKPLYPGGPTVERNPYTFPKSVGKVFKTSCLSSKLCKPCRNYKNIVFDKKHAMVRAFCNICIEALSKMPTYICRFCRKNRRPMNLLAWPTLMCTTCHRTMPWLFERARNRKMNFS